MYYYIIIKTKGGGFMKTFINNYSDKISLVLCIFNFFASFTHTKYGTLYSYLFKNFDGFITIGLFVVCYFLAKNKVSKYSIITIAILRVLVALIIFGFIFGVILNLLKFF